MTLQHTPGPWTVSVHSELSDRHYEITVPDQAEEMAGFSVADVQTMGDAVLLTAAPLLLKALEEIVDHAYDDDTPDTDILADFDHMRDLATAAIKQATGE